MRPLRASLIALAVIQVALVASYVYSARCGPDWLKDVSLNIGTEVFGILLTVWLIDTVIRKNEQIDRDRVVTVAFAQMRLPLRHHLTMLLGMYKAAVTHAPQNPPSELRELFGPDYPVQLAFLDFAKPAPLMNVQPLSWFDYFNHEVESFRTALTRTIEKYATFLDPETVELLESLIASNLLGFLSQARSIPPFDRQQGITRQYNLLSGQGVADLIGQHTALVQRLVALANQRLPQDKWVAIKADDWRNDIAPQFGSARL
jgi:hypothetical protein